MASKDLQVFIDYVNRGLSNVQQGFRTVDQGLRNMAKGAEDFNRQLQRIDQGLAKWQRTLAVAGAAGVGGLAILAQQGLKVKSTFEDIEAAFETMLKSKEKAAKLMEEVVKFTGSTPFQLQEVADSAQQLLSWGEAADVVIDRLRVMGDVAAIKKIPLVEVINALEKLRTTGHWESEQLVRAGVTAQALEPYIELDPKTGLPVGTGQQKFEAALEYLADFYGGGMEKKMGLLSGLWSNFLDNVTRIMEKVGDAIDEQAKDWMKRLNERLSSLVDSDRLGQSLAAAFSLALDRAKPLVEGALDWLDKLVYYLEQNPQALVNAMQQFLDVLELIGAALATILTARAILGLITAFTTIAGLLGGGGVAGAVAVVAGGIGLIALFNMFRKAIADVGGALPQTNTQLGETETKVDSLGSKIQSTAEVWATSFGTMAEAVTNFVSVIQPALNSAEQAINNLWGALGVDVGPGGIAEVISSIVDPITGELLMMQGWELDEQGRAVQSGRGFWNYLTAPGHEFLNRQYKTQLAWAYADQQRAEQREREQQRLIPEEGLLQSAQIIRERKQHMLGLITGEESHEKMVATAEEIAKPTCAAYWAEVMRNCGFPVPRDVTTTEEALAWAEQAAQQWGGSTRITDPGALQPLDIVFSHKPTLKGSPAGHIGTESKPSSDQQFFVSDQHGRYVPYSHDEFKFALRMPERFWLTGYKDWMKSGQAPAEPMGTVGPPVPWAEARDKILEKANNLITEFEAAQEAAAAVGRSLPDVDKRAGELSEALAALALEATQQGVPLSDLGESPEAKLIVQSLGRYLDALDAQISAARELEAAEQAAAAKLREQAAFWGRLADIERDAQEQVIRLQLEGAAQGGIGRTAREQAETMITAAGDQMESILGRMKTETDPEMLQKLDERYWDLEQQIVSWVDEFRETAPELSKYALETAQWFLEQYDVAGMSEKVQNAADQLFESGKDLKTSAKDLSAAATDHKTAAAMLMDAARELGAAEQPAPTESTEAETDTGSGGGGGGTGTETAASAHPQIAPGSGTTLEELERAHYTETLYPATSPDKAASAAT